MSKTYKGWELMKAIADGKIKNGTKIIPHYPNNDCTVEYFEYSYGFFEAYYKEGRRSDNDVNVCVFLDNDRTFEVIGDETDIDIDSIEELGISEKDNKVYSPIIIDNRIKINKLIQAVKQIDKRVKKLED